MWIAALRVTLISLLVAGLLAACSGAGEPEAKPRPDEPMTLSQVDALVLHIYRCWVFPDSKAASGEADKPAVDVRVQLRRDSSVSEARVVDSQRMEKEPDFRAWAESALRAIDDCGFPQLPASKYEAWREMVLRFEPQQVPPTEAKLGSAERANALTSAEVEAVRDQIYRCWNPLVGAPDSSQLVVMLRLTFDPDGGVRQMEVLNKGSNPLAVELRVTLDPEGKVRAREVLASGKTDWSPFFEASVESAMRAVRRCSPIKPPSRDYAAWRQMTLVFDPRPLIGQ